METKPLHRDGRTRSPRAKRLTGGAFLSARRAGGKPLLVGLPLLPLPARPPPSGRAVLGALGGGGPLPGTIAPRRALLQLRGEQVRRRRPPEFGAGDLATERVPVDLDFYVTPALWREKKDTVPKESLLVYSSLSFHLPSSLFPCPHPLPPPSCTSGGGHPPSGQRGPASACFKIATVPGIGGRVGGAACFRMLIRRSSLAYCLAFSPFSSLISSPTYPPRRKIRRRGGEKEKSPNPHPIKFF